MNRKEYMRQYRIKNADKIKAKNKQTYQEKKEFLKQNRYNKLWSKGIHHSSSYCSFYKRRSLLLSPPKNSKPKDPEYFKKYYWKNRDKVLAKYHNLKRKVFTKLGSKCACCGFTEYSTLQIDHIDDNGNIHRKHSTQRQIFQDVLDGVVKAQLLCGNCHNSKNILGKCYHTL